MGFQRKFLESGQPGDYETDIDALTSEGYNVIITVGPRWAMPQLRKPNNIRTSNLPSSTTPTPLAIWPMSLA